MMSTRTFRDPQNKHFTGLGLEASDMSKFHVALEPEEVNKGGYVN